MSSVFSKNEEKRSRSSTGESSSSFVKHVTTRVTGLLPTAITKWFSSPSSSSGNGSAPITDNTDSSTEDEAPESPTTVQPPAKRFRYSSSAKYTQLTTTEITLTSNVGSDSVLYNSISSPVGRHTFRRENNSVPTTIRNSSTSTMNERTDKDAHKPQHTMSAANQPIALKRKSLFDSPAAREASQKTCAKTAANTVKDPKQPYFKPHLLGSPFYYGRTMYGGASASTTYINQPNIKQRKTACVNESKDPDSVSMSSSARRIMDTLENYSSPLIDARRIPRYEPMNNKDINNSLLSNKTSKTGYSYKTQELYLLRQSSMISLKARNRLMESTKAARQIMASHSSSMTSPFANYTPPNNTSDKESSQTKSQYKLKSRSQSTRVNRGDAFTMPETVHLPTAVLEIDKDNLPKFTLNPTIEPAVATPVSTPQSYEVRSDESTEKQNYENFKFSSPFQIIPEILEPTASPPPLFEFDSPQPKDSTTSPNNTNNMKKTAFKASNDWKCAECWVSNKGDAQKCICCGAKVPNAKQTSSQNSTENTHSFHKLAKPKPNTDNRDTCDKTTEFPSNNTLVTKKVSSKWTCDDCWVNNEESEEKCVCCGRRNPTKGSSAPAVSSSKETVEKDWRCEDCLITNKPSVEKCAACGGAKPDHGEKTATKPAAEPAPATPRLFNSQNNKLKDIVKSQKADWECRVCLVSNPSNKSMCACCDAEREVPSTVPSKYTNFKFSTTRNPGFKFGIDPVIQESNIVKKVEETTKPKNPQPPEANNNIVPEIPNYTLTLPPKKVNDKVEASTPNEGPKPSFSFGIPKQNATSAATGFVPIKLPSIPKLPDIVNPVEDKKKEKAEEVPTMSFELPETTGTIGRGGVFGSGTPASSLLQNAQNTLSTSFLNDSADKNKPEPSNPLTLQPVPLEASTPQFSFSAKPTSTLFTQASTGAATNSSMTGPSVQVTTTASMMSISDAGGATMPSFFPKSNSANTNSMSLFPSNAAAAPAVANAAPMFSFGSNQGSPALAAAASAASAAPAAPAADSPKKFNFNFGSSSTTTFGATPQSSPSTFTLPTNSIGRNGPPNNPLENAFVGNGMAGNMMNSGPGGTGAPMFNSPPKEQMWPNTSEQSNPNPFMSNTTPKAAFSFGSSTGTPFGGAQAAPATQPVMFGASVQPAQTMFGQSSNQPAMFGSGPAPFGSSLPANPAPPMGSGMFGAPSASPFGSPAPSVAAFEAPSLAPAATPSFNFGALPTQPVFGFGQVQPVQSQMSGMCSFGGAASPSPVTFNMGMGNAPSTAGRRMRKAVRRNPQR